MKAEKPADLSRVMELTFPAGSERLVNEYCIEINRKCNTFLSAAYIPDIESASGRPRTPRTHV